MNGQATINRLPRMIGEARIIGGARIIVEARMIG